MTCELGAVCVELKVPRDAAQEDGKRRGVGGRVVSAGGADAHTRRQNQSP